MESGQKRRERSPEPGPLVRWELSLWTMCNESLTQRTFLGSGKNHRDNRQYWGGELKRQIETISCACYHNRWLLLSLWSTWQWTWEEQGWVQIIVIETALKKPSSHIITMRVKLDKNFLVQWRHEGRARLQKRWGKRRGEEGWTQVINFHVLFPISFNTTCSLFHNYSKISRTRSRSRDRAAGGYGGERRSDRRDKFAPY